LDKEVLHQHDVELIIGKRPYEDKKVFLDEPHVEVVTTPTNGELGKTADADNEQVNL
jgi:hypothetical protein